jgi:hypothetical protein
MNITRLCLIAGLLGLPVAYANAAQVTINVPVEITNVPTGVTHIGVECRAGVGTPPSGTGIWSAASGRGSAGKDITIPSSRNYRGVVKVVINAGDDATHYKCMLKGYEGQPFFEGQNQVSGPIPVDVPIRRR